MTSVTITLRDDRGNLLDAISYLTSTIGPEERKTANDVLRQLLKRTA